MEREEINNEWFDKLFIKPDVRAKKVVKYKKRLTGEVKKQFTLDNKELILDTISKMVEVGIKWTRIKEPVVNNMGQFGGLIQIDEDHFGNKYPPVDMEMAYNLNILFGMDGTALCYDYYTSKSLFERINTSDLLRRGQD